MLSKSATAPGIPFVPWVHGCEAVLAPCPVVLNVVNIVVKTPMWIGNTPYPLPLSTFLTFDDSLFILIPILILIVVTLFPTRGI